VRSPKIYVPKQSPPRVADSGIEKLAGDKTQEHKDVNKELENNTKQDITPEISPEITPEISLEHTPEITPEIRSEITPEITAEITEPLLPSNNVSTQEDNSKSDQSNLLESSVATNIESVSMPQPCYVSEKSLDSVVPRSIEETTVYDLLIGEPIPNDSLDSVEPCSMELKEIETCSSECSSLTIKDDPEISFDADDEDTGSAKDVVQSQIQGNSEQEPSN